MFKLKYAPDELPPHCGVKHYLRIQRIAFKTLGVDLTSEKRTFFSPILMCSCIAFLVPICMLMLVYAVECRNDLNIVTDILTPFWQVLLVVVKMFCFLWNSKKFVKIVRLIWLWNLEASEEEIQILLEENEKSNFVSLLFFRGALSSGILALISPIIVACFYYLKGYGFMDSLDLPLKAAYHLVVDPKSYYGYLLAYIWNVIVIYFTICGAVANDTIFSWIAHSVAAQFRILNLRFKTTAEAQRIQGDENNFVKSIISHIEYHQRVIALAKYFNNVFMGTVFFKCTICFVQFACILFQISRFSELSTLMFHIVFLFSVLLQLMIYCQGGQSIIDQSTSTAANIYQNFLWHDMSIQSKKLLLLVMMRSQNPCILTGVFFTADLNLFLWILKTTGSFFTMLKSVES